MADKWLLITQEQGAWPVREMPYMFLDAGIFTMNLLYALHYYKICACTLNAIMSTKKMVELQKILSYPESEFPMVFIAVGKAPDRFMIAKSRRKDIKDIVTII